MFRRSEGHEPNDERVHASTESRGGVATAERPRPVEHAHEQEVVTTQREGRGFARGFIRVLALPIAYVLALVQTVLAFRLAFLLMGANPANDFVDFVYDVGDPLAEPFQGIFANQTADSGLFEQDTAGLFEPATAIAMGVYLAIGVLLLVLIMLLSSGPSASRAVESRGGQRTAYEH